MLHTSVVRCWDKGAVLSHSCAPRKYWIRSPAPTRYIAGATKGCKHTLATLDADALLSIREDKFMLGAFKIVRQVTNDACT